MRKSSIMQKVFVLMLCWLSVFVFTQTRRQSRVDSLVRYLGAAASARKRKHVARALLVRRHAPVQNIAYISVTLETFHLLSGWLKDLAF